MYTKSTPQLHDFDITIAKIPTTLSVLKKKKNLSLKVWVRIACYNKHNKAVKMD